MKKAISILLLLAFVCTMITSCSKIGSRTYVNDLLDAMENGDDERFYELLKDESYNINTNPVPLAERIIFFYCGSEENPLEKACRLERYDYVEALIKRGADVDYICTLGALSISVSFMNPEIVELLLESGADPNKGYSLPLATVARFWNLYDADVAYDIAKMLIEYGADKSAKEMQFGNLNAYEIAIKFSAPQEFLDLLKPE